MPNATTNHTYPYRWTRDVVDFPDRGERAVLLWVCVDCWTVEASGEELDPEQQHAHDGETCGQWTRDQEDPNAITPGRLVETVDPDKRDAFEDHDLWTEGYETVSFGTERCDGCGCGLAGSRHAFTAWYSLPTT